MEKTRGARGGGVVIPNKLYFRIGEVSDLVGVKPYVLRYWESEFPDIKPTKSKSGQRLYKRRDVEMLVKVKGLLYDERFTINGARKRLKDIGRTDGRESSHSAETEAVLPRQLEVFHVEAADPEERSKKEPSRDEVKAARESSKVLIKIRRDLESILEEIHDG
ncbi:MAG: MerR family transcriptional regulator [Pseudomonadota bacterium]